MHLHSCLRKPGEGNEDSFLHVEIGSPHREEGNNEANHHADTQYSNTQACNMHLMSNS